MLRKTAKNVYMSMINQLILMPVRYQLLVMEIIKFVIKNARLQKMKVQHRHPQGVVQAENVNYFKLVAVFLLHK